MTATPEDRKTAIADLPATVDLNTSLGVVTLPHFSKLPSKLIRNGRRLETDVDQMFFMLEEVADDKTLALFDELPIIELAQVYNAWAQGAQLGESQSSAI